MSFSKDQWTPWPVDWPDLKKGAGCKLCAFLATEDPDWGLRIFADVLTVGRAVEQLMQPAKMNYEILGNNVPHVHAHVVPRPQVDPTPRDALRWTYLDDGRHPLHEVHDLAVELRRRLGEVSDT